MATIEEKFNILIEKITGLETKLDENNRYHEKEINQMKSQINELSSNMENYRKREENNTRRKNIIIFGLEEEKPTEMNKMVLTVLQFITSDLRTYDVIDVKKINFKNKNGPILVKLNSIFLKRDIMRNKYKLMKSEEFKQIKIKDDMPKEVRSIRKELYPFMKAQWEKGNKASLRYDKLLINDKIYCLEELQSQDTFRNKRERSEDVEKEMLIKNKYKISEQRPKEKKIKDTKTHHRSVSLDRYLVPHEEGIVETRKKETPSTGT